MAKAEMKKIERTDPEAKSADLVAENIARLRELFPELITEGEAGVSVNVDVLKQLVGDKTVTDAEEKYGLNWHGKRAARQLALTPSLGTLRPCPEDSVDWDTTQNLMIEGDNLEVLKLLQKSYAGKVKLIYIDPPYNIAGDRVYEDDYSDGVRNYQMLTNQIDSDGRKLTSNSEALGRKHTRWLTSLLPRLTVARQLLRNDGVIFISIDDEEFARLRQVADEVFGEENFCGAIKRRAARKTAFLSKRMTDMCDYIAIYAKSDAAPALTAGQISDGTRPVFNGGNPVSTRILRKGAPARCADGVYQAGVHGARTLTFKFESDLVVKDGKVQAEVVVSGPWRINQQVLDKTMFVTRNGSLRRTMLEEELGEAKLLNDLLDDPNCYNELGSEELKGIFGVKDVFNNPKPTGLIEYLIAAGSVADGDLILDFYAGSGTTMHAALRYGAGTELLLRSILVQLPEPLDSGVAAEFCDKLKKPRNIAELTKERLRRAGKQVRKDNPKWRGDTGFRVFKLDSSNIKAWDPATDNLEKDLTDQIDHLKVDRTEQDILYELLLKLGLDLCVPTEAREIAGKQVFSIGGGVLMACLDKQIERKDAEKLALGIAEWHKKLNPAGEATCVFRDAAFADDVAKTNLAAILNQHGITTVRSI